MLKLTKRLTSVYSDIYPNLKFQIYGGGTKSGIEDLLEGRIDICTASRNLTPLEAKKLADYYGSIGMYYLIAKDAVSIYVNQENEINNLTIVELKNIFTCDSNNINSMQFTLALRDQDSGTRRFFRNSVLQNEEYCDKARIFSTTEEIIEFVKENKNGIGFGGIGLAEGVKLVSVEGIAPNIQNAKNDRYPLTRYLHFFTSRSSSGTVKKFIDWVLSPEGQKIVKEEGFIPLWEINY